MSELDYLNRVAATLRETRVELKRENDRIAMLAVASTYDADKANEIAADFAARYPEAEVRLTRTPDLGFDKQHPFFYIGVYGRRAA